MAFTNDNQADKAGRDDRPLLSTVTRLAKACADMVGRRRSPLTLDSSARIFYDWFRNMLQAN